MGKTVNKTFGYMYHIIRDRNVTDNKQKLAVLSHCMEAEADKTYDNPLTWRIKETFDSSMKLLINDFNPYKNIHYEIFQFCQIKQNLEEISNRFYSSV